MSSGPKVSDSLVFENSIEFLRAHTDGCRFARADIANRARSLAAGEEVPVPAAEDAAGLKVDKNALAIVFIPTIFGLVEEVLADQPDALFILQDGMLEPIGIAGARAQLDPQGNPGIVCQLVYRSISNVFVSVIDNLVAGVRAGADDGDPEDQKTSLLLDRYEAALNGYHRHTKAALDFTPTVHVSAGIHTALFFILRVFSAIMVLGAQRLGRQPTPTELSAGIKASTPLLLAIARCHLEQLMALEVLLGKADDLFMTSTSRAHYEAEIARMFRLAGDGTEMRVELSESVMANLPRGLTSDKPRTSCPALFTSTGAGNAIAALIRMTERAYLGLV